MLECRTGLVGEAPAVFFPTYFVHWELFIPQVSVSIKPSFEIEALVHLDADAEAAARTQGVIVEHAAWDESRHR